MKDTIELGLGPVGKEHLSTRFGNASHMMQRAQCIFEEEKTAAEKKEAQKVIDVLNVELNPEAKAQWELNTDMQRLNLRRRLSGRKPQWKFTKVNGALVKKGKAGGIDWYRYEKEILVKKLLPWAQELKKLV